MIDLTVKTLDSQNHVFSLDDDITVRQFKEHIAETVSVSADSQRLIYCGRVLQDEKRLSEYDVNGKVIHLVQRPPPPWTHRGNGGGQSQNRNRDDQPQSQRTRHRQARTHFHGNPMYLGSFSIPAEVVDGHEWPIRQLRNTWSNSRLYVARRMLDQANRVIDRLENPSAAAANEPPAPATDEAASDSATPEAPQQDGVVDAERLLMELTGSGPMGRVIEFARAFAGSGRAPYRWPMRGQGSGAEPSAPTAEAMSDESQAQPQDQQQQQQQQQQQEQEQQTPQREGANNAGTEQPGNGRPSPPTAPQGARPPQMAQMLGRLMDTQDRLRPFLLRYRELMELDPEIPGGRTVSGEDFGTVEDNQRLADGVTECMHFLSHANHALSDIIVDVGQQPPRNLRCRPMLIQHSAILQAGIPIQVEAHISVAQNDGSNGESGEESGDATGRPPTSSANPTSQNPIDLTFMTEQSDQSIPAGGQPGSEQQQQQQQQAQSHQHMDSPLGAIFNITNNMEVLMEMGPPESGAPPDGNTPGTEQAQNNGGPNNNNNNAPGTSGVAGIFPWGPMAPPPEVIRNLMHVVAGYMAQSVATVTTQGPATTTSTATPTTGVRQRVQVGVGTGAAPNPGQSTQARSNVGTHPTTSTQTRSTARPHVFHPHAHALGVGMGLGQNMDFDPFLPCNSHHIQRNAGTTPTTGNNTATSTTTQPAAQPAQTTTANGAGQTQPDAASTTTGEQNSAQPPTEQRTSSLSLKDEIAKWRESGSGRSGSSNNADAEISPTLEELLLARGMDQLLTSRETAFRPHVVQRLFAACSRIEISEWFAYLNNGRFNRDDVWRRLRPQIRCVFSLLVGMRNSTDHGDRVSDTAVAEFLPYYINAFDFEERRAHVRNGRRIDLPATIEAMMHPYIQLASLYVGEENATHDDEWGVGLMRILKGFVRQLVSVLRFSMRRGQTGLDSFIRYVAIRATTGHGSEFRDWILGSVVEWMCAYCRQVEQLPNGEIVPLLVYKDSEEMPASTLVSESSRPQETQSQPEPEPMETEEASGNRIINDPLELDNGEEVPTTFSGHEALLPEWVPIIARDGIRQRRQLQLQGGAMTPFSDAYLEALPSKRRKLVEQQKPRLLVSPTPNNSSIPASVERLVRENVVRAGVEEAEGAASAVAGDAGVRRAFGQAIRDCLNPRRLQTPDFPDSRRFPNATKFFADKDAPSKQ